MGVLIMAVNSRARLDGDSPAAFHGFAGGAAFSYALIVGAYYRASQIERARPLCRVMMGIYFALVVLLLLSFVPGMPPRAVLVVFVLVQMSAPLWVTSLLSSRSQNLPLHLPHFTERLSTFVLLVLGDATSSIAINPEGAPSRAQLYAGIALCFLGIASIKLFCFDTSLVDEEEHAVRISRYRGIVWTTSQSILMAAISLCGSGARLVLLAGNGGGDELGVSPRTGAVYLLAGHAAIHLALVVVRAMHSRPEKYVALWKFQLCAQLALSAASGLLAAFLSGADAADAHALPLFAAMGAVNLALVVLNLVDEWLELRDGAEKDDVQKQ